MTTAAAPPPGRVAGAILGAALAVQFQGALRGEAFLGSDLAHLRLEQADSIARALTSGTLPLWDPRVGFGQPTFANPNAQVLYPFTWLHAVVQPWTQTTIYVLGHAILGAVGMYLLLRKRAVGPAGSLTAALALVLGGPALSLVPYWNHYGGLGWTPWVLLACERVWREEGRRAVLLLTLAVAAQALTGSPDVTLQTAVLAVVLRIMPSPAAPARGGARPLGLLVVGAALGLALVAVQLVPAAELARHAGRTELPAAARTYYSLPGAHLAGLVVPAFMPGPVAPRYLPSIYLGLGTVLLAASAARRNLVALGAIGLHLLVALGPPGRLYDLLLTLVPPLQALRYPEKAVIGAAFLAAVLAGTGGSALAGWLGRRHHALPWVVPLAVGADLLVAHHGVHAMGPAALLSFRPPVVDALRADGADRIYVYEYAGVVDRSRLFLGRDVPYIPAAPSGPPAIAVPYLLRSYLFPPLGALFGLRGSYDLDVSGLSPQPVAALSHQLRRAEGTADTLPLLRAGSVTHVVSLHARGFEDLLPAGQVAGPFPEPILLFRVPAPLPRARVASLARVLPPAAITVAQVATSAAADEVLLPAGAGAEDRRSQGTVDWLEDTPARVRLACALESPGYVVITDAFDAGWSVRVDGEPAAALPADLAFRAVAVPAGRHLVEWRYVPAGLGAGLVISAGAALAWIVAWATGARPALTNPAA